MQLRSHKDDGATLYRPTVAIGLHKGSSLSVQETNTRASAAQTFPTTFRRQTLRRNIIADVARRHKTADKRGKASQMFPNRQNTTRSNGNHRNGRAPRWSL